MAVVSLSIVHKRKRGIDIPPDEQALVLRLAGRSVLGDLDGPPVVGYSPFTHTHTHKSGLEHVLSKKK